MNVHSPMYCKFPGPCCKQPALASYPRQFTTLKRQSSVFDREALRCCAISCGWLPKQQILQGRPPTQGFSFHSAVWSSAKTQLVHKA
eukprot:jgi/Chrzof1/4166/Cz14g01140.t1